MGISPHPEEFCLGSSVVDIDHSGCGGQGVRASGSVIAGECGPFYGGFLYIGAMERPQRPPTIKCIGSSALAPLRIDRAPLKLRLDLIGGFTLAGGETDGHSECCMLLRWSDTQKSDPVGTTLFLWKDGCRS